MKKTFPLFLCGWLLAFSSCIVSKPDTYYTAGADYNQRVAIKDAHYRGRTSIIGHATVGLGTLGSAYLGYQLKGGVVRQNGEVRQPLRPANAALGALTGFAVTNMALYLLGKNKKTPATNANEWLQKANHQYLVYEKQSESNFTAIPHQAENSFIVKGFNDTKGFYRTFPNSLRKDAIFQNSIGTVQRGELPELIKIQPNNRYVVEAQLKYYESSASIIELLEARQRFPDVGFPVEKRAAELVGNMQDITLFRSTFGTNSTYSDYVFEKLYPILSVSDLIVFIDLYANAKKAKDAQVLLLRMTDNIANYASLCRKYSHLCSEAERLAFERAKIGPVDEKKKYIEEFSSGANRQTIQNQLNAMQEKEKEKIKQQKKIAKEQADREDAERIASEAAKRDRAAKIEASGGVGMNCSFEEVVSRENDDRSIMTDFFGLSKTKYLAQYDCVVERMLGDNYKVVIISARLIDPKMASVNYFKYRNEAVRYIQRKEGQTLVKPISLFKCE